MDNYLSGRWPTPVPSAPERHEKKKDRRKGRRVWRDVLVVFLALVILGALVAGSFFGVQYAAERLASEPAWLPDLPYEDEPPFSTAPVTESGEWSADLLPRADCDPSAQLEPLSREGEAELTATEIYKKVLPSIVCVQAYNEEGYSVGSGIIVSESGYIITNYHVIEEGLGLAVMLLSDMTTYDAALVGYDKELDLAILKAEGTGFVPAEIGDSDELEVGDAVYAIGNPMGYLYGSMSDGIVSALSDRVSQLDYPGRLIQTTAALNSGNSGGALVDSYGRVVGITYAKVTGVQEDVVIEGIGLAIPLSDARPYLNRIFRTGSSARPSLGIQCYSPVNVDGVVGILVSEATKGTPAEGKLFPEDLIIAVNGIRVYAVDDVTRILSEMDPGDEVELTVIRKGKEITVVVELYDRLPELQ